MLLQTGGAEGHDEVLGCLSSIMPSWTRENSGQLAPEVVDCSFPEQYARLASMRSNYCDVSRHSGFK
jgi:hypothetical protein